MKDREDERESERGKETLSERERGRLFEKERERENLVYFRARCYNLNDNRDSEPIASMLINNRKIQTSFFQDSYKVADLKLLVLLHECQFPTCVLSFSFN